MLDLSTASKCRKQSLITLCYTSVYNQWNVINILLEVRTELPLSVSPRAKYSTPKYFEEQPLRISKNCQEIIKFNVIGGHIKYVAKYQLFKVGHIKKQTLNELQECYFIITRCNLKSWNPARVSAPSYTHRIKWDYFQVFFAHFSRTEFVLL